MFPVELLELHHQPVFPSKFDDHAFCPDIHDRESRNHRIRYRRERIFEEPTNPLLVMIVLVDIVDVDVGEVLLMSTKNR